ncbi:hypothetical protein PQR71_18120 [Paraburkholderia fungorum]|uniref:hypothetical protein n=1 Tax=Paraburkholderia fungorum TaxID=134537 RepID=UPI0038BBF4F9
MKKTLVAACLVAVASGLHAEESAGVKEISVADCKLPRVAGQLVYEEITRTGNMAKTMIAMLSTMQAISAKAPDSKRPIKDTLSADDLSEFSATRVRVIALQTRQIIESRYERHLELLQQVAQAVDTSYRWGTEPDEKSPIFPTYGLVRLLANGERMTNTAPVNDKECSLDLALYNQERDSIAETNDPRFENAANQIVALRNKYRFAGPVDRNKLSATDKLVFDRTSPIVNDMQRTLDNIKAVEQLRLLASAMKLVRETDLADLDQSAGDPNAVGNTLVEMQKAPGWDARMTTRVGAWAMLDKQYPSEMEKNLSEASDLTSK